MEKQQQERDEEAGEDVTSLLQRRLSVFASSDASLRDRLTDLLTRQFDNPDVVFHVHGAQDSAVGDGQNVLRVLAHSSVLRKESDYFREILQRQPNAKISTSEAQYSSLLKQEDSDFAQDFVDNAQDWFVSSYCSDRDLRADRESSSTLDSLNFLAPALNLDNVLGSETAGHPCTDEALDSFISYLSIAKESMEEQDRSEGLFSEGWPNTNEASFSAPVLPSELPSRKSILLDNEERKNSISGSIRKSVRFSLQPASTILSMPITDSIQRLGTESVRQLDAELLGGGSVQMEASSVIDMNKYLLASRPPSLPECIDRSLIRRRHTEVNIVMQRENTKESFVETDNEGYNFKYYVVKKLTWTIPVLAGIMEWVYLGTCHVNLEDLPHLYDAAYRAVLTSLTWSIRCHPMPDYLNVALASPFNCQHLLKLCSVADCMELTSLKAFCEALQQSRGQQKIAILETKDLPGTRAHDFLVEGFLVLEGHPLCVLKTDKSPELESPTECENGVCIEDTQKQGPVLTFERHTQSLDSISRNFAGAQKKRLSNRRSPEQAWKVVLLDDDPAGSFYAFFKHASLCSLRNLTQKARTDILKKSLRKESVGPAGLFKLQMITRFKVGSILVDAIRKAFRQGLTVKEKRGSGSFIKGPSYCTSIVIKGDPCLILMAAKAIPYDMIGRSALKIRVPNAKTFSSLFHASHTFGVDLNSQSIVLVKPLYVLIKVLEFVTKLNADAYEEPSTERTFIELCTRVEPF